MRQQTNLETGSGDQAISSDRTSSSHEAAPVSPSPQQKPSEREALFMGWYQFVRSHNRDEAASRIGAVAAMEAIHQGLSSDEVQRRALEGARRQCSRIDSRLTKPTKRARELLRNQDPGAASAIFEQMLAIDPTFTDAIYGLASTQEGLGRYELAAALFERFDELVPGYYLSAFHAGACYLSEQDSKAAVGAFANALRVAPVSEELMVRSALAQAQVQAQQYAAAGETVAELRFDGRPGTSTLVKCLLWGATADYYLGNREQSRATIEDLWRANLTDQDLVKARRQLASGEPVSMFEELATAGELWS